MYVHTYIHTPSGYSQGGCSGRGVQWMGVVSYNQLVYLTSYKPQNLFPLHLPLTNLECPAAPEGPARRRGPLGGTSGWPRGVPSKAAATGSVRTKLVILLSARRPARRQRERAGDRALEQLQRRVRRRTYCAQIPTAATRFPLRAFPSRESALESVQGKVSERL